MWEEISNVELGGAKMFLRKFSSRDKISESPSRSGEIKIFCRGEERRGGGY